MTDIPELFGKAEVLSERPLEPATLWVIVAYYSPGRYWTVRPSFWCDKGAAVQETQNMSPCWTHRRIVRIELP